MFITTLAQYSNSPSITNYFTVIADAPCASDLISEQDIAPSYELGSPLRPVEQLLCVLPVESVEALPIAARFLMTSPQSPIYDMFHGVIETDRRNERAWLWIQLLPFVDVNRIISAVNSCDESFTEHEKARNTKGSALLYVHPAHISEQGDDGSASFVVAGSTEKQDKIFGHVSALPAITDTPAAGGAGTDQQLKCFEYSLPPEAEHRSELKEGLGEVKFIRLYGGSGRGGPKRGGGKKRGGRGGRGGGQGKRGDRRGNGGGGKKKESVDKDDLDDDEADAEPDVDVDGSEVEGEEEGSGDDEDGGNEGEVAK